jgi:hypothetical protein
MQPLDFQAAAIAELTARANAFFAGKWRGLPLHCRWASLMTGPTGVGKTTCASIVASACGASLCRIGTPNWLPLGVQNRGAKETTTVVAEHIAKHERTLLVVDELDKVIDKEGDTSWKSYIRNELFDLADGRWPAGLNLPEDENWSEISIEKLTEKLQRTVFILGIGTFQSWFDDEKGRRTIGFSDEDHTATNEISAKDVAERLPRELANRFNSNLIRLPELKPNDYHRIAKEAEDKLPNHMKEAFREEVTQRIGNAITCKKGVRFLEEALMATLMNLPPEPLPPTPDFFQITPDIDLCRL